MAEDTIGYLVFGLRSLSDKLRHYALIADFVDIAPDLEKAANALDDKADVLTKNRCEGSVAVSTGDCESPSRVRVPPSPLKHEATHTALRMCFMLAVSHPEGTPFCPCYTCTYLREIRDTFAIEPIPKEDRVCWCADGPLGFCPRHSDYQHG
jgi:hypothetical protein